MTKQMKADIMLLMVTLFWGISYWLVDLSLAEVRPFMLNALRFLIAFFVAGALAFPKLKTVNKATLKYSALIGVALLFVYIGATFGVRYTSLSNAGFLCALTVVITPVLAFALLKQKPEKKLAVAVLMCLIGISLLTLKENAIQLALGDLLCIMAAFAYAVDLLITETAVKKEEVNAFQLGVFQLGFTGIYNLVLAFLIETPALPKSASVWSAVLFLSIFCTGAAFIAQAVAQQYTSASHVGVIFSLEPVFAGFVAFFLAGEILTTQAYIGAAILVSSLFIMELDLPKLLQKLLNRLIQSER
ncbi:DMT family transporter [Anoxybacterium hadale]|uniref:DMT family transporter n=1 Tax=Anoxybacterium hadale TaxID=3408580 RepID=A0ACD1AA27_9FIRM|nr:DMT family transporter [Clostridiales bacterium]